jgi:hypothetical protein
MKRIRFSIASLLVVVFFLAVGCAALRESTDLWESAAFTLTLGVLLASILLALHRTAKKRAFWIGFALWGGSYLGLSLFPSIDSRLLTTKALLYIDSQLPGRPVAITGQGWAPALNTNGQVIAFSPQGNTIAGGSQGVVRIWNTGTGLSLGTVSGTTENFVKIGHSLLALLLACAGGQLSRWLHGRNGAGSTGSVPAPVLERH